jgi:ketosteroid isomerase-like protein
MCRMSGYVQLPVADELAIRSMFARYVHLLDSGDARGWADLFTEDASWTRLNSPPRELGGSGLAAETISGRENLYQMAIDVAQKRFNLLCRHQMTDVFIEAGDTPDTARGQSRAMITDWNGGSGKLAMVGDYTLAFRRTPQGWRIQSIACDLVPKHR